MLPDDLPGQLERLVGVQIDAASRLPVGRGRALPADQTRSDRRPKNCFVPKKNVETALSQLNY